MQSCVHLGSRRAALLASLANISLLVMPEACTPTGMQDDLVPANGAVYRREQPAPVDDKNSLPTYVAQCEAVLGKIPVISCDPAHPAPGTTVTRIPVFSDGTLLGFGGPRDAEILAQRAEQKDYRCDFPSIGGNFACSVGSTLVHYQDEANPNVQWVGLCRGVPYDNPNYDRFVGNGLIGANELTGEMCFFFGSNNDPDASYTLPGLRSDVESAEDLQPWLPPEQMPGSCVSCHPNNDPWILTPWLQPSYMESTLLDPDYPLELPPDVQLEDTLAARYIRPTPRAYAAMLPDPLPEGRTAWTEEEIIGEQGELLHRQYRVVGSSYVQNEARGEVPARFGIRPDSWNINFRERLRLHPDSRSCAAGCHAIGNEFFTTLAVDSLGEKYASEYLSDSMTSGDMPGFGWMPPVPGPREAWREMFENATATVPAITECPIPKRLEHAPDVVVDCELDPQGMSYIEVSWQYTNDYGDVPGRDDIRFDVALAFNPGREPQVGVAANDNPEGVHMDPDETGFAVERDVAPVQPAGDNYRVRVPFTRGDSVLRLDIQPKRFCFEEPDRRPFAYAQPYTVEVSTDCDQG